MRVLAELAGKPAGELRIGLGRDMRLTAPELARALPRRAWSPRARTCSTPGMVGTEMLYFLVGSRELDGGLMCTASHNPKAYTGAKLVARARIALSAATRASSDIRARRSRPGSAKPPGGGSAEEVDVSAEFHEAALALHRPGATSSR